MKRHRLAGRAVLACAACAVVLGARVRSRADELIARGGAALLSYGGAAAQGEVRSFALNGARFRVLSGRSADPPAALLDAFGSRCVRAGGGFADQLRSAGAIHGGSSDLARGLPLDGVLRSGDGQRGYVACFDLGGVDVPPATLFTRVRRFIASGDLAAIGDLRFAWVERAADTTHYVGVWTDGPLPLRAMFPTRGDAPGSDVPGLPRPDAARRVLSVSEAERAPLLVAYALASSPDVAARTYAAVLRAAGFELRSAPAAGSGSPAWLLRRGSVRCAVLIARGDAGGSIVIAWPWR
jgi:hypothetical protein